MNAPILIVSSDSDLRELIAYGLVRSGWTIECAASGGGAFARICGSRPAGVVLDLALPDIHGVGVIEVIRQLWPDEPVPIVILCSEDTGDYRDELLRMGADAVLTQPFTVEMIVEAVDRSCRPVRSPVRTIRRPSRSKRPGKAGDRARRIAPAT